MTVLLLFACAGAPEGTAGPGEHALWGEVQAMKVDEGDPVVLSVRLRQPQGWTAEVPAPVADGLEITAVGSEGPLTIGDGQLSTWRYELRGPPGSYVIEPGTAAATGPAGETLSLPAEPLFVDVGVAGPTSTVSDFEAVPDEPPTPWALYAALGAAALGVMLAAWLLARSRRLKPTAEPPPLPAHVLARQRWSEIRAAALDDHGQALALSRVLREYLEAITGWPVTMRTGSEILAWMERDRIAGASARLHAAHILDATDRLKFAREGGGEPFFLALDEDFEAIIEATRPATAEPGDPRPPAGGAP